MYFISLIVLLHIVRSHCSCWRVPDSPTGSDTESVKVHESLQKPLQRWKFVQRAGRWQSVVSSLTPDGDSEHGVSCSQKSQMVSLCSFQIVQFTEEPC